ncbi:MAG: hypothetical protein ACKOXJ_01830, partial [Alphaproteobacteria bacterium]
NLYLAKILRSPEGDGNANGQEKEETPPTTPRGQEIEQRKNPPPAPQRPIKLRTGNEPGKIR